MKRFKAFLTLFLTITLTVTMVFSSVVSAAPYTIKSGDTLWDISKKFGTGPTALMKANKMKSTMIYPGQRIQVPDSSTHFVNYGDTLWKIAQKYGVSMSGIIKLNGLKNPNRLYVGQIIKIPQKQTWKVKADKIINTGLKYIGTPYQFGARSGQTKTFDCSSFVRQVFRENGFNLKRSSRSQYKYSPGWFIKKSQLRRGDVVFFDYTKDGRIDHVAIYYGNNKLLHTYRAKGVEVGSFSKYWHNRYVGAKRYF